MTNLKSILDKIPKPLKTLTWNFFYQALSFGLLYVSNNLGGLGIPAEYAAGLGIVLSAISKYLATKCKQFTISDGGVE